MHQQGIHGIGILFLSILTIFPNELFAQIYKWVDADGKVHYGDKPRDPGTASAAQPVELENSYQPAARPAQEQEAYDTEQYNNMLRDQVRRREDQQAQEKARAQHREEQARLCASYAGAIKDLTTVEVRNGKRVLKYIQDPDGKSISSEHQRQIIEDLKVKMVAAGCD